jgi:hypothetical protein
MPKAKGDKNYELSKLKLSISVISEDILKLENKNYLMHTPPKKICE